jgi:N-methylhydantoinase B
MELLSNADRSLLNTYGLKGGLAGGCYGVAIDRVDGSREEVPGLADDVPVREGDVIEIVTTGGGGWGDPLQRDPDLVRLDVVRGLVSERAAREAYGVVLGRDWERSVDTQATAELRARLTADRGEVQMFDRGPYHEQLRAAGTVPARPDGWDDPDRVS